MDPQAASQACWGGQRRAGGLRGVQYARVQMRKASLGLRDRYAPHATAWLPTMLCWDSTG